jgi:magnesium chelatase subunit D
VSEAGDDAALIATLLALDPAGLGGVALRGLAGPVRDGWLARLRAALPPGAPVRRVPLHVGDERLLGGLDLAATLQAGRPVRQAGILAEAAGGVVVLAMAERVGRAVAGRLTAAMDATGGFGVVALDEGMADDEAPPPALLDRLAFRVDLDSLSPREAFPPAVPAATLAEARVRLPGVMADAAALEALCATALALGVWSLRAPQLALRVARMLAALAGRDAATDADAATAARLVFSPRATRLPQAAPPETEDSPPDNEPEPQADDAAATADRPLDDIVLQAAAAAIPAGLLAQLAAQGPAMHRAAAGRAGMMQAAGLRGRPAGVRRGEPGRHARLNVIETLRAAAPWQRLRGRAGRIQVRRDDFRVTRYRQRTGTTTIFAVDASGSAALHRLAETKGAVELLLAESYARRDQVAVLAFRGTTAELLLPPTRSLVRAKRSLAALPGGGGTPLAAAIEAAAGLADAVRRRGSTPIVVLLTDGRANVSRGGNAGRAAAEADALAAAGLLGAMAVSVLLVDTSPRPHPAARGLAAAMAARYFPLPQADAAALARAIGRPA